MLHFSFPFLFGRVEGAVYIREKKPKTLLSSSRVLEHESPDQIYYIVCKIIKNKCSDTLNYSKLKIIYALNVVLKNLHTHCKRNIHAYHKIHKNTNILNLIK